MLCRFSDLPVNIISLKGLGHGILGNSIYFR